MDKTTILEQLKLGLGALKEAEKAHGSSLFNVSEVGDSSGLDCVERVIEQYEEEALQEQYQKVYSNLSDTISCVLDKERGYVQSFVASRLIEMLEEYC